MVINTGKKPYECHIWYTRCMLWMSKWFHTICSSENIHKYSQWFTVIWMSCLINHVHFMNVKMTSRNLVIWKYTSQLTAYSEYNLNYMINHIHVMFFNSTSHNRLIKEYAWVKCDRNTGSVLFHYHNTDRWGF